ncbi:E3 ubiquitin-protein ligase BRE1-like 1 [Prunus yedoensis var. nudiflora]|uniref:E3 ubiquitin-protein ligase BRE1-like 1 n=1 Tax=Prunus yedoensis var. nudiflora TaxID=2094558 RepID=A0A314ZTC8_PRUYE|nr:E3 ubiquitin-protein ligase BRE1-like 1 [Prunus yedoensis var. nudiflora]
MFSVVDGELEAAVSELADSNCQLATLKAESDAAKGAVFPVLNFGNKHVDRDQASSRLMDIKGLHEERIKILQQLSGLQYRARRNNTYTHIGLDEVQEELATHVLEWLFD